MKKFILALLLSSVLFYGCDSEKEKEVTESEVTEKEEEKEEEISVVKYSCEYIVSDVINVESELEAEDDTVTYMEYTNSLNYKDLGLTADVLIESTSVFVDLAEENDGFEYSYDYDDNVFEEKLSIDLTEIDLEFAIENGIIVTDDTNATYVSLEKTIEVVEQSDGSCTEK